MTLLRRLIAFFYLLFRVVQRGYFQAQRQWENTSWKRWSQCFFDRASFRFYYHSAKDDFSRLYEGWRHRYAVSLNGNPVEYDLLEQWWVNVNDLVRDLEIRRRHLRHHWQQENNRAEVFKSELYAAWMALDEKQEQIDSWLKPLATSHVPMSAWKEEAPTKPGLYYAENAAGETGWLTAEDRAGDLKLFYSACVPDSASDWKRWLAIPEAHELALLLRLAEAYLCLRQCRQAATKTPPPGVKTEDHRLALQEAFERAGVELQVAYFALANARNKTSCATTRSEVS